MHDQYGCVVVDDTTCGLTRRSFREAIEQLKSMDELRRSVTSKPVERIILESGFQIERALTAEGKLFKLKIPINVAVLFEDGSVVNQSSKFSITALGATREDALQSFCEDFAALYEHIAHSSDDALTEGARSLKSSFLETVEEVVEQ